MSEVQRQDQQPQAPGNRKVDSREKFNSSNREAHMNNDQAKGKFDQLKGKIKETWGRLSEDDVALYNGKRDQFLGKLEEKYGLMREEAESKLEEIEQASGRQERAA